MAEIRRKRIPTGLLSINLTSPVGLLLATVMYIAVNTLFSGWSNSARMDVTEEGLYTLSAGTQQTLRSIDAPVTLHYFYSEKLGREVPFYRSYGRRIRELLVEIASASQGKVIIQEHNPEPFTDAEDLAVSHGVQGIPLDQSGALAYFGLSGINAGDETRVIPFFQAERENLLEYDLVNIIYGLANTEPPVLGVMSSLPLLGDMAAQMQGNPTTPWAIAKHLRSNFNVLNLPQSVDDLPDNIDIMMVVHPQTLNQRTLYQLEQFMFRGGRAIFFIDPKSESDYSKGPDLLSSSANGLEPLFDKWGVRVPEGQLVGDRSLALQVNAGTAAQPIPAEYLVWLNVPGENIAQSDPVTSQLSTLNLATSGYIDLDVDSPLALSPLIFSSVNSSQVPVQSVSGLRPDILGLLDNFQSDEKTYVMAGRLVGQVSTAFPDGAPPRIVPKTGEELQQLPHLTHLVQSTAPINMIVVADSDLLEDRFWIRKQQFFGREVEEQIARNADFVVNAISNLAGSDALLALRSRGTSQRPFEKVLSIQQQAETRLQEKERALQSKLKETQQRIAEFEGSGQGRDSTAEGQNLAATLTAEQRGELEVLRLELVSIRKQLRSVQAGLRKEVLSLERWLQFLNIGLMPLIVIGAGILFSIARITRQQRKPTSPY